MSNKGARLLLLSILLALLASGLFWLARVPESSPMDRSTRHPSQPWQALPTRALSPTATPTPTPTVGIRASLDEVQSARLRGDLDLAQDIWERLAASSPPSPELLGEGVRLALARDDAERAESLAWRLLTLAPGQADTWVTLGLALERRGALRAAEQAYRVGQSIDPTLAHALFGVRWAVAQRSGDAAALTALAQAYAEAYPEDGLRHYYQAVAGYSRGESAERIAGDLIAGLETTPDAPAAVWYILGQAYLQLRAFREASLTLEVAARKTSAGDPTMSLVTDAPEQTLQAALGQAYLGSGRCVDAEVLFRGLIESAPEVASLLNEAITCQTPTPTLTPWIPPQLPAPGLRP